MKEQKEIDDEMLYEITNHDLKSIQHRSIGVLTSRDSLKRLITGTATLLSKNLIITAAHNLYDKRRRQEYRQFKFYVCPFKVLDQQTDFHEIQAWKYMNEYKTCEKGQRLKYDYAIMKLKTNIERPIKFQSFLTLEPICGKCRKEDLIIQIFGYPNHHRFSNYCPFEESKTKVMINQYGRMAKNRVTSLDFTNCKITYTFNTYPGQSGTSIIAGDKIIALHNGAGKENQNYNLGRLIDESLIHNIYAWCKEINANPPKIYSHSHFNPNIKRLIIISHKIDKETIRYKFNYNDIKNKCVSEILEDATKNPAYYLSLMYKRTLLRPHDRFVKIEEQQIHENEVNINLNILPNSIRLYFYKIIYNQYKDIPLKYFLDLPNIPDDNTSKEQYIRFIIKLYEQSSYYHIMNKCLRQFQTFFKDGKQEIIKLIVEFTKIQRYLPFKNGKVYRSMANFYVGSNQNDIQFPNFTASSSNRKIVQQYLGKRGTVFNYKCLTGRNLSPYLSYSFQSEVLLPPFSYFSVENRKLQGEIQHVTVAELPGPLTYSKNILIWVNDKQTKQYPRIWESQYNFETIHLLTTRLFKKWYQIYGWLLKWKEIKVKIVTNMSRNEEEGKNQEAGLQLMHFLRNVESCQNSILISECESPDESQKRAYQLGINQKCKFSISIQEIKNFASFS